MKCFVHGNSSPIHTITLEDAQHTETPKKQIKQQQQQTGEAKSKQINIYFSVLFAFRFNCFCHFKEPTRESGKQKKNTKTKTNKKETTEISNQPQGRTKMTEPSITKVIYRK